MLERPAVFVEVGCALAAILLVLDITTLNSDLRNGLVPVAGCLLALSTAGVLWLAGRESIGRPRRIARAAAVVSAVGLAGIAGFFAGLAVLSMMESTLLSADTPLTAATSFAASVLVFVVVPLSVVAFGICLLRDRALPTRLRVMPWALVGTVLGGGLFIAWIPPGPERWVELGWFVLLASLVSWSAVLVASESRRLDAARGLARRCPEAPIRSQRLRRYDARCGRAHGGGWGDARCCRGPTASPISPKDLGASLVTCCAHRLHDDPTTIHQCNCALGGRVNQ
jgi:hypothetical protein